MYLFLNFIPVIINILALPLLNTYGHDIVLYKIDLYGLQSMFNDWVVPIYLLIINIITIIQTSKKSGTCIFVMCLVIFINSLISYIEWGLKTGLFFNPDSESVMFAIYFDTVFPILIMLFGMLIFHFIRKCFIKSK